MTRRTRVNDANIYAEKSKWILFWKKKRKKEKRDAKPIEKEKAFHPLHIEYKQRAENRWKLSWKTVVYLCIQLYFFNRAMWILLEL